MRIIGFDYPCMDMNILCPHMPTEEELVEFQDVSLMGGGKIANAVAAVARLGAETAFIGAVGNDRYGKLCVEDLKMLGVDGFAPGDAKRQNCFLCQYCRF